MRAVGVYWPNPHGFCLTHRCRVYRLKLVDPFRHGIVVHLFDWDSVHHVLFHDAAIIAVHFCTAEEDHSKSVLLLGAYQVLGPNHVRSPKILVIVFSIPAPIFSRQVVYYVKFLTLKDSFDLSSFRYITSQIMLVPGLIEITYPDFMSPVSQFWN